MDIEALVARTAVAGMHHIQRFYELEGDRDWDADLPAGQLRFAGGGSYPAELLGSTSTDDQSFMWAWANPSVAPGRLGLAAAVRDFGAENGVHPITDARFIAPPPLPLALLCVGLALSGAHTGFSPSTATGNALFLVVLPQPIEPPDVVQVSTLVSAVVSTFAVPHRLVVEGAGEAWEWPVEPRDRGLVLHHPEAALLVGFDAHDRIDSMSAEIG